MRDKSIEFAGVPDVAKTTGEGRKKKESGRGDILWFIKGGSGSRSVSIGFIYGFYTPRAMAL